MAVLRSGIERGKIQSKKKTRFERYGKRSSPHMIWTFLRLRNWLAGASGEKEAKRTPLQIIIGGSAIRISCIKHA
jgi:hypothetical protein